MWYVIFLFFGRPEISSNKHASLSEFMEMEIRPKALYH